ncbi:MAG: MFS transporter, partial [Chloroflexi bacterium]|nr:MFS transporter [Chloroflexota bacterium]
MSAQIPLVAPLVDLDRRTRTTILATVLLGLFLAAIDGTVVGTALPRIVTDLRGNDLYTWAFTAYLLTATISGPIYGKLSDLFGRRPVLLVAVAILMVGSLLAGLAAEMWQLIGARALQGLGAGALFPIALAVIADLFPPSERGKYQGLVGAVFAASSLVGPAVGGLVTDTVGWPWVFFLNLPLGAVIFAVIWRSLPPARPAGERPRIDYAGAAILVAALVPILVGLTNSQAGQWTDPAVGGLIALGVALAGVFIVVEARAAEPIVPPSLFRNRSFVVAVGATFLTSMAFFATVVFLPRWFQVVGGASASASGYQILPLVGAVSLSAIGAGQIAARTGRVKALALAAPLLLAAGLYALSNLQPDTAAPLLWAAMAVAGMGVGPAFAIFILVVQNSVPVERLGTATSNVTLFQQLGGTVGLAVAGTVFGARFIEQVPRELAALALPASVAAELSRINGGRVVETLGGVGNPGSAILAALPPAMQSEVEPFLPAIVGAVHQAFTFATAGTFLIGVVASLGATLIVTFLQEAQVYRAGRSERRMSVGERRSDGDGRPA